MGMFDFNDSMLQPRVVSMTPLGGGGTGGNNQLMQNLLAQLQSSFDAANSAGLAQYKNLLGSVKGTQQSILGKGGTYGKAMGQLNNFGRSAMSDINLNTANQLGAMDQSMVSRGLGNTTLRSNAAQGVNADAQRQKLMLQDQIAAQKSGLFERQAGMQANMGNLMADSILSRQNVGPDMSQYLTLIQQLAQSQPQAASSFGGSGYRSPWDVGPSAGWSR